MSQRTQVVLASILGGFLLFMLVRGTGGGDVSPSPGETLATRSARLRSASSETPLVTDVLVLELEKLEPVPERFEVGRDPFRYGRIEPEEPPPPPPRRERPRRVERVEPETVPVDLGPVRPRPPSADHLTYLGSFGPPSRKIAVVIDGEGIYNVQEGDVIQDTFSVEEIGYESIDLGFVAFPDEPPTRLPVGG